MSNIKLDSSHKPVMAGISSADSETPIEPWVNPTYRYLHVGIFGSSGSQIDTFPISGTITANLGAIDNAVLDSIDEAVSPFTTIFQGTKTVPTGTAEAIASTQAVHSVTVKALSTNTVAVYVGASGVTTANGFELLEGESISLDVDNLATIFVISGSASQVVRYIGI